MPASEVPGTSKRLGNGPIEFTWQAQPPGQADKSTTQLAFEGVLVVRVTGSKSWKELLQPRRWDKPGKHLEVDALFLQIGGLFPAYADIEGELKGLVKSGKHVKMIVKDLTNPGYEEHLHSGLVKIDSNNRVTAWREDITPGRAVVALKAFRGMNISWAAMNVSGDSVLVKEISLYTMPLILRLV